MTWRAVAGSVALLLACSSGATANPPAPAAKVDAADEGKKHPPALPVVAAPAGIDAPFAVEPYFDTGLTADAALAFRLEKWQDARDGFAAYLASKAAPKDKAARARVTFLVARCDASLGNWADAAKGFDAVAADLPLLADYASYDAARAYYFAHDLDAAADRAGKVAADAVMAAETQLLVGDILRAQGDQDAVAAHYAKYLGDHPDGIRAAEASYRLGEALAATGQTDEAIVAFRAITISDPLSAWADDAQKQVDTLAKSLPKKQRKKLKKLTADELITRGKVYFDAMRNDESEKDFAAALDAKGVTKDQKCVAHYNRAQSIFKQRRRADSATYFEKAIKACKKAKNEDLLVRSAYQGGRAFTNKGDYKKAIELFALVEEHPTHTFADDARVRQAEAWEYLNDKKSDDKVEELLSTLPDTYPDGDMRAEALWRLAWKAYRAGDYDKALTWLDKQIAAVPHDDNFWAEGQAPYWKARTLEKLGRADDAVASYEACIREYPLSYYALHALNRLREGYPDAFDTITAEIRAVPAGWTEGTPAIRIKPRDTFKDPGFVRAVELLRIGLGAEAERELARLGFKVPPGKKRVSDPDQADQLWATAVLFDRARRYDKSHWILRWFVLDYKTAWPTAANRALWDMAYPRAWWHLIEPAATAQGYPPELLISFVREESAFDPTLESFANAIGLTQMILPTAKRFGKDLGKEIDREVLRNPEDNVFIGSRFLGFLWTHWDGTLGLVVPSYNAGEGAVKKWVCARGDWPLDEWAEQIPYDETRNYSKRVLSTFFTYSYLTDGTIPTVPNVIPADLIASSKCPKADKDEDSSDEKKDKPDKKK